ncbi:MAG: hypothetical protein CSA66_04990 [Proteobacteria bacterium]|nr:MAG: hypothetical protein CSA66_04990 [Pseudomonadota bacterium]
MPNARMQVTLNADAADVWKVVGPFDAIQTWHPAIGKAELSKDGQRRTLHMPDGSTSVERIVTYDDAAMQYRYAIVDPGPPLKDMLATFTVMSLGGKTVLTWEADFDAVPGAPVDKVKAMLEHIFGAAKPWLVERFGAA